MLDVVKLATLREVIAHGSFSAAASALSLTQPAVSRQVSVLEAQLSTQLVRRTRQGVVATEAGALLATHADAVIGRLERATAEVAALAGLEAGHVRVGMFFTAFAVLAPEVAAHAEARHPRLTVSYELVDRRTAFRRLIAAELDLALVFEHRFEPEPAPPGVELVGLFEDPARVLLPSRHRLARRKRIALRELAGERWIRPHDGSAARLLDRLLPGADVLRAGHGDEPVETQVHVAAGAGVALAHELNVLVNPGGIAVRALTGAPARSVQAAFASGQRAPGPRAILELLRTIADERTVVQAQP
jgi:DNA-binding transcriptional LysR family regulator